MPGVLGLLGVVAAIYGMTVWSNAGSVMHQIAAIGLWTCGAVLVSGAAIVAAIAGLPKAQKEYEAKVYREAQQQAMKTQQGAAQ